MIIVSYLVPPVMHFAQPIVREGDRTRKTALG